MFSYVFLKLGCHGSSGMMTCMSGLLNNIFYRHLVSSSRTAKYTVFRFQIDQILQYTVHSIGTCYI